MLGIKGGLRGEEENSQIFLPFFLSLFLSFFLPYFLILVYCWLVMLWFRLSGSDFNFVSSCCFYILDDSSFFAILLILCGKICLSVLFQNCNKYLNTLTVTVFHILSALIVPIFSQQAFWSILMLQMSVYDCLPTQVKLDTPPRVISSPE